MYVLWMGKVSIIFQGHFWECKDNAEHSPTDGLEQKELCWSAPVPVGQDSWGRVAHGSSLSDDRDESTVNIKPKAKGF